MNKVNLIKILTITSCVLLAGALAFGLYGKVQAGAPHFNIHPDDPTDWFQVSQTGDAGTWNDPISAEPGNSIFLKVYYHNNAVGTVAENTRIKIEYPTQSNQQINLTGLIISDNSDPRIISNGLSINVPSSQRIEFDPANAGDWALWCPNASFHEEDFENNLPSGDFPGCHYIPVEVHNNYVEVVLGDIQGCFEYRGAVIFMPTITDYSPAPPTVDIKANGSDGPVSVSYNTSANLTWTSANATSCVASGNWSGSKTISGSESTGNLTGSKVYTITCTGAGGTAYDSVTVNVSSVLNPDISIVKTVRNVTQGTSFSNYVLSSPSDQLEFRIEVSSTGSSTANNVKVRDIIPSEINYLSNLKINGYSSSGDIQSEINLGNLATGTTKVITFDAQIFSGCSFSYGTTIRINNAYTWADAVSQHSDTATISIYKITPPPHSPGLSIDKKIRNTTDGTSYQNSINADPGEDIEFQIKIGSIGTTTAYNVIVTDVMPSNVIYRGDLRVNGITHTGSIINGLNIGSMVAGTTRTITFDAEIASEGNFNYQTTTIVNTASVNADDLFKVIDSASLSILKNQPLSTEFSIEKRARNMSSGQTGFADIISALPSDKVAFQLEITNSGDATAVNVVVKDALPPAKIAWYGNVKIDGVDYNGSEDITDGIHIGNIVAGGTKTIIFEALLSPKVNFVYGITELTNVAMAYNAEISDSNSAKVRVQNSDVAGAVTEIPTGILDNAVLSLAITFLVTYCLLLAYLVNQRMFPQLASDIGNKTKAIKTNIAEQYHSINPFHAKEKSEEKLTKIIEGIRNQD